ncbi:bifunctional PIG-L family deacetylase/class I SAM-dependent methyltransferase [Amycolatopsis sp. FDAARGOS 1241]|uniref:bifunctional PIG-L family deacetylase/class I SAM-dependent methyltransferase n=1 Tax=Amycolatopsis sp. FDAARGOS 1241 TaxID=2778070 RepID=UPI00194FEA2A|nr:bifunctional PIG-L family deacetylase/class I SAM-dependent methyltransferase [Amycolatopsis sp. FDAARGOS 1241]QRP49732.1 bifunctional PIG-L family deacetylase/class I SAM-dependent methyltransferase [Amycolatopsis sp. FDAARGOS 1241]
MTQIVAEAEWTREFEPWRDEEFRSALVVAAHPDDETLGASGLVQHLHAAGTAVTLVVATDGEAAFPGAGPDERRLLGRTRRVELARSLDAQGLTGVEPIWLGLPDSGLAGHIGELTEALRERAAERELCLMPWPEDPHPDHQAAGRAAVAAAPLTAHCWAYPIWLWHWCRPDSPGLPWHLARAYGLSAGERAAKAAGIREFGSQLKPGPRGEEPILAPEVLAHFDRPHETFFRVPPARSAPVRRFAELYAGSPDPWEVATSWYERRKRGLLLASLPCERYGTVVEPGCGTGALTRELAGRCTRLLASDPVPEAVRRTREATAGMSSVDVHEGAAPGVLPAGPVDLVVFGELLYYLGDADLDRTVERAAESLAPGGEIAAVHWRHWAPEAPRDGRAAHRRLLEHPRLEAVVAHDDEEFLLHVLRRR